MTENKYEPWNRVVGNHRSASHIRGIAGTVLRRIDHETVEVYFDNGISNWAAMDFELDFEQVDP